jgi:ubiquinone/menaquinone biosynthesis C-methylase UbiE
MKGRPAHYQDPEVVRTYGSRFTGGINEWKDAKKSAILKSWIDEARPTRVLEVACGPGRFGAVYRGHPTVGCDLSREMLRSFRGTHPRVPAVRGDAAALPFRSGSFEVVFATRFLSHLRAGYRAQVLAEMVRVTRDRVILDGRHRYNLRFLSRWVLRTLRLAHAHKLRHTYRQFREELEGAGLEVLRMRSIAWGLSARFLVEARKRAAERD